MYSSAVERIVKGQLLSVLLMFAALMVGRTLLQRSPKASGMQLQLMARAMVSLGFLVAASLPGADGATWQLWTSVGFLAAGALLWVFTAKRRQSR